MSFISSLWVPCTDEVLEEIVMKMASCKQKEKNYSFWRNWIRTVSRFNFC